MKDKRMPDTQMLILLIVVALLATLFTVGIVRILDSIRRRDARARADEIMRLAQHNAEAARREIELEAKTAAIQEKEKAENEFRQIRKELHDKERSLDKRQDIFDKQVDDLRKQERLVENTQRKLSDRIAETTSRGEELAKLIEKQRQALYELSGLTQQEASERLLHSLELQLQEEAGAIVMKHERLIQERCDEQARNCLLLAMHRFAAAHTAEATTSTVDIPNDDMKGRIIGREGRNIRTFEKVTGVDIIIDDTPGVVIVSGFDPVRREVARIALNKLITDGRIHPTRIEELVAETNDEVQNYVQKAGEEACQEVDVFGLNPRIVSLLGRLRFRTSFSQNVLRHSIEVAFLSGVIAAEIGLNEKIARRCGLLHDIGKAVDHEVEGGHPKIGADLLKRYGESADVIHAALGHHDDARVENPYTVIVAAADACSAARPGARRETLEHYTKRMEDLESLAMEFSGVEQAYAIQAGREMRVLVDSGKISDTAAAKTCRDIVKALTERMQFPGEIKVTVIRETRTTEIAK
ncbi:MAG: ribonuclease Y [Planctomycetaceae bacterium]|jgi:ribonuclease Y|nr:ribonuclease Y [Planctomycetaceae bacterium]